MNLYLEKPALKHQASYEDMMAEWEAFGGALHPGVLRRLDPVTGEPRPYEAWLAQLAAESHWDTCPPGLVPQDTLFLVNAESRVCGAISIRHELTPHLLDFGGHIGAGIRPSERRKGYATQMLAMALPVARSLGIERALWTCTHDNIGSMKTVLACGGVLEDERTDPNGVVMRRYWLDT